MSNYYVYKWVDPNTNIVFYIGKGTGRRAYNKHSGRCQIKRDKLLKSGIKNINIIYIIKDNLREDDALILEENLINKYRIIEEGGCLFNFRTKGLLSGSWSKIRKDVEINNIITRYNNGETMYSIAGSYNVHETTIRKYLRQNNIKIRSQGYTVPYPNDWNKKVNLINEKKLTCKKAIQEWNFSYPTFLRLRNQAKINGLNTID
jgi:hypothetical protein